MPTRTQEALQEFWATKVAKVGVVFLVTLILISVFVLVFYPLNFGEELWNNPIVWADNPKAVGPSWTQAFSSQAQAEHLIFELPEPVESDFSQGFKRQLFQVSFLFEADEFPQFTSFTIRDVQFQEDPPFVTLILHRPDGEAIILLDVDIPYPEPEDSPPYVFYSEDPRRIYLSGSPAVRLAVATFARRQLNMEVLVSDIAAVGPEKFMFGVPSSQGGRATDVLKGEYTLSVLVEGVHADDAMGSARFVVAGQLFGLMGTDNLGRDLAVGLLFGFPVALFIGVVTSTLTAGVGGILGVISGYKGGKVDMVIQRTVDILNNVPLLPILIFLLFIVGSSLWNIVILLVAFGWTSLTIIVRSMVLQIRDGEFIQASVALGAGTRRIIFRHILPQVAPFILAQLIFFTPSAILAEAALSFLGLGDPSIPTWGQILDRGFSDGALYLGYWWWIIPPGILIVIAAVTFVLIALGFEPVINPRLRRRR